MVNDRLLWGVDTRNLNINFIITLIVTIKCGILITKKTLYFQSTQHNLYFVTLLLNNTLHLIKNVLGYLIEHQVKRASGFLYSHFITKM
jgi:tryptophanyl-tRNA synthetase